MGQTHTCPVPLRSRPLLAVLLLALALPGALPGVASAAQTCSTTNAPRAAPTYSVTVCLTVPDGALSGQVPVSAEVTVSPLGAAAAPAVASVVFWFRGTYLLTDFDPAYGLTWRTTRTADGPGTLEARVRIGSGSVARVGVPVDLANGAAAGTSPPVEPFTVRTGTAPEPGRRTVLAAVGDGVDGSARETLVAARIASWSPDLLAYLGDVYQRGSAEEFENWYSTPTGYGQFRDITNPVVGNHEYQTPGAAGFFDFWGGVPHYYSYDVAGWHFVALDSTGRYDQLNPGSAQYDWLEADLAANRSRCTMVYMHHPRYSVAAHGGRWGLRRVWSLMAARRVTLAVAGHSHAYERWTPLDGAGRPDPRGVTQLIAGAGGREVRPSVFSDARLVTTVSVPGALRLDLGAEDAQYSYVGADGATVDGGTIGCTSTGDPLPPTTPGGLSAAATSSTTAALSWTAATDQYTSVAGYTLRRNGAVVATLDAGSTTYADAGLVPGETYSWTVDAFDTSQNFSPQSATAALRMPAPPPAQASSRTLLGQLRTSAESGRGYDRARFRTWTDDDADGCDSRSEVLFAEALSPMTVRAGCAISGGRWLSRYDGVTTTRRGRLRIEHLVPLREAWQSGARGWSATRRAQLANDLGYAKTLNAATGRMVRAKGAQEPRAWLPPRAGTRCAYLAEWVAVKWRWRLSVDRAERRHLARRLASCGWPDVDLPARPAVRRR